MIEMKVRGIAIDPNLKQPAVILTDEDEKRYLPIWIGVAEATAIFLKLSDQSIARPMTHDLMKSVVDTLGAKVSRVLVSDINQHTFFARVYLENPESGEKFDIDARPSDAIALALRTGSPIFVAEKVVVAPGVTIVDQDKVKEEMVNFKKHLENLSPTDFDQPGKNPS